MHDFGIYIYPVCQKLVAVMISDAVQKKYFASITQVLESRAIALKKTVKLNEHQTKAISAKTEQRTLGGCKIY